MSNQSIYKELIDGIPNLPLFFNPWYLDATCTPDHWDVAITKDKGSKVTGVLPYFKSKKYGLSHITMPLLAPYLGPWIIYPDQELKAVTKLSFEKKVITDLLLQLPSTLLTKIHCHPKLNNILPAHWAGYDLRVRYTYQLHQKDTDNILTSMDAKQRNIINKNKSHFKIVQSDDIHTFWELNVASFTSKGEVPPYTKSYLLNLYSSLQKNGKLKLYFAKETDNVHCGILTVHDQENTYCLAIGNDPLHKNSGALSSLMYHVILDSLEHTPVFNFEGGMIPNIEKFFRSFGGELTPYYRIEKAQNKFIKGIMNWAGKL